MEFQKFNTNRKAVDRVKFFGRNYPDFVFFENQVESIFLIDNEMVLVKLRKGSENARFRLSEFFEKYYPRMKVYYNE